MAMNSDNNEYYAFVESIEKLPVKGQPRDPSSELWQSLLSERQKKDAPRPTHEVWLDCIGADYFDELPWLGQPFDPSNAGDRRRRRGQILELERGEMVALNLALSKSQERENVLLQLVLRGNWLNIAVTEREGIPTIIGADFSVLEVGGSIRAISSFERVDNKTAARLHSVFNVDFIPPMDFDGGAEPGGILPSIDSQESAKTPPWMVANHEDDKNGTMSEHEAEHEQEHEAEN